jgi:hypothetical protein
VAVPTELPNHGSTAPATGAPASANTAAHSRAPSRRTQPSSLATLSSP